MRFADAAADILQTPLLQILFRRGDGNLRNLLQRPDGRRRGCGDELAPARDIITPFDAAVAAGELHQLPVPFGHGARFVPGGGGSHAEPDRIGLIPPRGAQHARLPQGRIHQRLLEAMAAGQACVIDVDRGQKRHPVGEMPGKHRPHPVAGCHGVYVHAMTRDA